MIEQLHTAWSWVVVLGNAAAGLWCLLAHWWAPARRSALWVVVAVVQATIFVEVALGVVLVTLQGREAPGLHEFYGFLLPITVAILYGYRTQVRAWQYLLYGFGGLFLMGLGIRAMILG